jgi:hypothetical protein
MAGTPFLARLFAALLPHSLADIETNPCSRPRTRSSVLSAIRFATRRQPLAICSPFLRLRSRVERQAAMPAKPGRSLVCFSPSNPIPNEILEGGSGHHRIALRAVAVAPSDVARVYWAAESHALTFKAVSGALYPRPEGRGLTAPRIIDDAGANRLSDHGKRRYHKIRSPSAGRAEYSTET